MATIFLFVDERLTVLRRVGSIALKLQPLNDLIVREAKLLQLQHLVPIILALLRALIGFGEVVGLTKLDTKYYGGYGRSQ